MSQMLGGEPLRVGQKGAQGDQNDARPNDANKVLEVHLAGLRLFGARKGGEVCAESGCSQRNIERCVWTSLLDSLFLGLEPVESALEFDLAICVWIWVKNGIPRDHHDGSSDEALVKVVGIDLASGLSVSG